MRVAIVGNKDIDFLESDIDKLYKFALNVTYPHPITFVYSDGWSLVESMAERNDIPYFVCAEIKDAILRADSAVIIRYDTDRPWIAKYCVRKGKLFQEKVVPDPNPKKKQSVP